ncbi:GspH/FimT family pseudopilin [Halomonas urumqiensis]|nr:GspH/FimT family pseudopilin [Halomonas urumqiensis]GHE22605.1 hypothetical protein GCM10017767_31260 [Halomonas urumqiensis]
MPPIAPHHPRRIALYHNGSAPPLAKRTQPYRQHGLTLIELLVTIAVLAVLVTQVLPSYQRFVARNEVAAEVMRIKTALALARNTAITRRKTITVCPVAAVDAARCELSDWSLPLVIVEGKNAGTSLEDTTLLRILDGTNGPEITFNRDRPIRYQSTGWARGHNGTFTICLQSRLKALIVLSNYGRLRTIQHPQANCS